jgi:isopenicillin N synthase-like dioxygenase
MKLAKYHVVDSGEGYHGVGPHKDSSGWLTFLYQVGEEPGLEVLGQDGEWIRAGPIPNSFVVNFGNAFEAATEGAVRATVHRVKAPTRRERYSIPFFMGLPLDLKLSEVRGFIPAEVRSMRCIADGKTAVELTLSAFLDSRWDSLGESQLRKWIRSHEDVGRRWYGPEAVEYYTSTDR